MKPELTRKLVNIGSTILAGAGSLVSPGSANAEPQRTVNSDECIKQPQGDLILLGGEGCFGRLNILLASQNGSTLPMLTEVKEDLASIDPMQEVLGNANIYGLLNVEDLGCDQNAQCDWDNGFPRVRKLIDRIAATGMIPHETMVVIKSNDGGGAGSAPFFSSHSTRPAIYSPSAIVRRVDTRGSAREVSAGTAVHEFLHQYAGFDHEGNDIMQRICNCINADHARFLRSLKPLTPFNYDISPQLRLKTASANAILTGSVYQVPDLSVELYVNAPPGTTRLESQVLPFNNDGAGVFDEAGTPFAIHAWGEIGRRVPPPPEWYGLLPDMTYTWRVRVSGSTNPDQTEIWPGVFVPNPWLERNFHTAATTLDTIALKNVPTTNDLTPTLTWENTNNQIFYYEVQVSKDPNFNTEPATATAAVYWELRHGGVTNPKNAYTIPNNFPLEKGTDYFWRVRPRVQGDGKPMEWTPTAKITTTADAKIKAYSRELIDKDYGKNGVGPSEEDYNKYASKEPEYVEPSSLARVINLPNGWILIPEEGAKDYSNSSVKPVRMAEYGAYLKASQRRLQQQRGRKLKAA